LLGVHQGGQPLALGARGGKLLTGLHVIAALPMNEVAALSLFGALDTEYFHARPALSRPQGWYVLRVKPGESFQDLILRLLRLKPGALPGEGSLHGDFVRDAPKGVAS